MAGASVGPQYTILYNDTTAVVDYALLERIQAAVDQAIRNHFSQLFSLFQSPIWDVLLANCLLHNLQLLPSLPENSQLQTKTLLTVHFLV